MGETELASMATYTAIYIVVNLFSLSNSDCDHDVYTQQMYWSDISEMESSTEWFMQNEI